jgi:hypothetical protein
MPGALGADLDASASCEAPGKSFLLLFFKKEGFSLQPSALSLEP